MNNNKKIKGKNYKPDSKKKKKERKKKKQPGNIHVIERGHKAIKHGICKKIVFIETEDAFVI